MGGDGEPVAEEEEENSATASLRAEGNNALREDRYDDAVASYQNGFYPKLSGPRRRNEGRFRARPREGVPHSHAGVGLSLTPRCVLCYMDRTGCHQLNGVVTCKITCKITW